MISMLATVTAALAFVTVINGHDFKGFDDTILFKLNWPGNDATIIDDAINQESIIVTTHNKEKYKCTIPNIEKQESEKSVPYNGPGPFELVSALFTSATCSYRIESYWTYEICHGNYIKQFHEEREGKNMKLQEYSLGAWTTDKTEQMQANLAANLDADEHKLKFKKIDTATLPYLEIEMTDGTYCDLNGEHRSTKVQYVCYPHGKNEVYSLKETSTCQYEVIILTPTLCPHPLFKPQETSDNNINCIPVGESPTKPRSLLMMEVDSMKKLLDVSRGFQRRVTVVKLDTKDGTLRAEVIKDDFLPTIAKAAAALGDADDTEEVVSKVSVVPAKIDDTSPVRAFLEGKHCLTGGTGWWKYEFCYGRFVRQFHIDKNGETSVMLGYFNENSHKKWLNENPQKRPKPIQSRTHLTHFYQGGSICDKTGEKRQTEVKLKCLENSPSSSKVSLYLMEPQTCQYILGVESPLICEILAKADSDGLVSKHTKIVENPINDDDEGESPVEDENDGDVSDTDSASSAPGDYFLGNGVVEDAEERFVND